MGGGCGWRSERAHGGEQALQVWGLAVGRGEVELGFQPVEVLAHQARGLGGVAQAVSRVRTRMIFSQLDS